MRTELIVITLFVVSLMLSFLCVRPSGLGRRYVGYCVWLYICIGRHLSEYWSYSLVVSRPLVKNFRYVYLDYMIKKFFGDY